MVVEGTGKYIFNVYRWGTRSPNKLVKAGRVRANSVAGSVKQANASFGQKKSGAWAEIRAVDNADWQAKKKTPKEEKARKIKGKK